MSVQTRSRSDKNAAVLGSREPRQVPAFLNGLHRHTAPLPAANREMRACKRQRYDSCPQGFGCKRQKTRLRYAASLQRRHACVFSGGNQPVQPSVPEGAH